MFTLSFVDFSDFALFTSFTRLLCLQPTKISVLFPPKTTQKIRRGPKFAIFEHSSGTEGDLSQKKKKNQCCHGRESNPGLVDN